MSWLKRLRRRWWYWRERRRPDVFCDRCGAMATNAMMGSVHFVQERNRKGLAVGTTRCGTFVLSFEQMKERFWLRAVR